MKRLIFSLILAGCSLQAFAQQELIHPKEQQKQGMVPLPQPYIQINGQQIAQPSLALIKADNIESIDVLKDENATGKFGDKAKGGAILIKAKYTAEFSTMQDIYTLYRIPAAQQTLKVVINNKLVKDTNLILANLEQIEKVEVKKQDITAPVRWSLNDEEEFLHIIPKPQTKQ
ncbi:hypothetical protein [Pontibacter virosus]|uniref:TonB-dependent receptor-like protein n=1 Tax=Pontibacter virosus TaxID=1765052 RepID=A0A2U1AQ33_9BACT|nr:hypothetical protein [Pontibacter virosus]PVY38522.1 hypothetical protein C8E01_11647 [Pontibacter virosus]